MQTRTAGSVTSVEFHLVVPGRMAVKDVHKTCDRIEGAVRKDLGLVEDTPENDLYQDSLGVTPGGPIA